MSCREPLPPLLPREDILDAVRTANIEAGLVLVKGSAVRGDHPIDDVDVTIVKDESAERPLPTEYLGVTASNAVFTRSSFLELIYDSPRAWNGVNEGILIAGNDEDLTLKHKQLQEDVRSHLALDLGLYLVGEQAINANRADLNSELTYYDAKRLPGSKRTVMRALYLLQVLHPELYDISGTTPKVDYCLDADLIDAATADSVHEIFNLLAVGQYSGPEWQQHTDRVTSWMQEICATALDAARQGLPADYIAAYDLAVDGVVPDDLNALEDTLNGAASTMPSYRKWLLRAALCLNPHMSPEKLITTFYDNYKKDSGRVLARYAIRNAAFPIAKVMEQVPDDLPPTVRKALDFRLRAFCANELQAAG
jgi:hypothetical protein